MIGTYAAVLVVCGASLAIGQAAIALCGLRRWSWLAPAVGFALLCAVCWGTARLPGDGATSAAVVLALALAAAIYLRRRLEGGGEPVRAGLPVALVALAITALPFIAEGHFGILGTGFNPDMAQHLLASERLAHGDSSQLLVQGYPLGPHAVVVALHKGLGIGLVQGFSGLTVAVAVLAALTALTAFADWPPVRRTAMALLVGLPYLVASYFAQGAFKETIEALLVLAFVLALRESSRNPAWRERPLRLVPAALIAVGAVYAYSFAGLVWLGGAAVLWAVAEQVWARRPAGREALLAAAVFGVGTLPELGRMIDFRNFETFDPSGPGLGNLFGQISPLEALGVWPSGDFRLAPGDGAAPAALYYLGAALAAALLVYALMVCWRRREGAILGGLLTVAGVYLAARIEGTPYTAAKALEVAAPLVTLTIAIGAFGPRQGGEPGRLRGTALAGTAAALYALAAAGCSLLAFANAPVGPDSYSSGLAGLRPLIAGGSTLVLAPRELLDERHGERYIAWELRGGRVCIEVEGRTGAQAPKGIRHVVTFGPESRTPFGGLVLRRRSGPYLLWERRGSPGGPGPCPLVAVRQARQGPAAG